MADFKFSFNIKDKHQAGGRLGFCGGNQDRIAFGFSEIAAKTPLLMLERLAAFEGAKAQITAKADFLSPVGGSALYEYRARLEGIEQTAVAAEVKSSALLPLSYAAAFAQKKLLAAVSGEISDGQRAVCEGLGVCLVEGEELSAKALENSAAVLSLDEDISLFAEASADILKDCYGIFDCFICSYDNIPYFNGVYQTLKAYNPDLLAVAVVTGDEAISPPEGVETLTISPDKAREARLKALSHEYITLKDTASAVLYAAIQKSRDTAMNGRRIIAVLPNC